MKAINVTNIDAFKKQKLEGERNESLDRKKLEACYAALLAIADILTRVPEID